MSARIGAGQEALPAARPSESSRLYTEGVVAGGIGAATVAVWFFILDLIQGRPLYTPTVLGMALFHRGEALAAPAHVAPSFQMVLGFTWIHALVFVILGGAASRLLGMAEKNPNLGFGILLLFLIFEFGFVVAAMLFAEPVLQALTIPSILIGNLLAAGGMGVYFWRKHPNLVILP